MFCHLDPTLEPNLSRVNAIDQVTISSLVSVSESDVFLPMPLIIMKYTVNTQKRTFGNIFRQIESTLYKNIVTQRRQISIFTIFHQICFPPPRFKPYIDLFLAQMA